METQSFEGQILRVTEEVALAVQREINRVGEICENIDPSCPLALRLADVAADLASAYQRLISAERAFQKEVGWL